MKTACVYLFVIAVVLSGIPTIGLALVIIAAALYAVWD